MRRGLERILAEVWDDGNAVGLDGWIGPGRGEPIDSEAVRCRERAVRKSSDELFSDEAVERVRLILARGAYQTGPNELPYAAQARAVVVEILGGEA
ncbi:hypothetical protein PP639_gp048 [Arthrobacter phage Seahorse]|uniref:Uncharacterized protein n=1 Tax=Arthrobacter phage Seahorse TaxID=2419611 RepID=A0A3G3M6F9_9CAUD|nr:hypothetical protein PP639_gp048 [Arthrobacter phage Seahorse]AYR01548.1 hypothetical protein PBI_SEAHORSE_48 [Arthrobacter phage Seahorse]